MSLSCAAFWSEKVCVFVCVVTGTFVITGATTGDVAVCAGVTVFIGEGVGTVVITGDVGVWTVVCRVFLTGDVGVCII